MRRRGLEKNSQKDKSSFVDAKDIASDSDEIKISNNELDSIDNLFGDNMVTKNKKNRPLKKRKKSNITHYATIGMTKKEYKVLVKKAKKSDMSLSSFILNILDEAEVF